MSRIFFRDELEGVATYWRVTRRDGVTLGFTSHNRDLTFLGLRYRSAPGMLPSSIRRTASLERDSLEVQGILAHDAISDTDLRAGRYDGARVTIGLVDWETLEHVSLFAGEIGAVSDHAGKFEAELQSAKASLDVERVPRTSPSCRASFCNSACRLNPARYTHLCVLSASDPQSGKMIFAGSPDPTAMLHGSLRWIDGPHAGQTMEVIDEAAGGIIVDRQPDLPIAPGSRALLREGCDHTLTTCIGRFANSVNFQGEPYLPGNDLLARYPTGTA